MVFCGAFVCCKVIFNSSLGTLLPIIDNDQAVSLASTGFFRVPRPERTSFFIKKTAKHEDALRFFRF